MAFTKTEVRRITFLSLLNTAATAGAEDIYNEADFLLGKMEEDGFFEEEVKASRPTGRSGGRNGTSGGRGSSSRPSNRGSRGGGGMRDPDGPPSDKQVAYLLKLTDDYTEDELYDMTKQEVSDLIEDLKD